MQPYKPLLLKINNKWIARQAIPLLTILLFFPSLPVNSDGLYHLAQKRGWRLELNKEAGGVMVKFTESVLLAPKVICTTLLGKGQNI